MRLAVFGQADVRADVVRYRIRSWNVALDSQVSKQSIGSSSECASLVSTLERFTRNRELGLDVRTLVGGTIGRYLIQGPGREWRAGAGLAASTEVGADGNRR